MTTSATRNGTKGERLIVNVLSPTWPLADRRAKQGAKDRGDIGGIAPGLVIEAKYAPKRYEISEWLKEADREGINDNADLAVVWFKLKGTDDPLKWPVMMRGRFFLPLLQLWTNDRRA
jgi:hypothetical protein